MSLTISLYASEEGLGRNMSRDKFYLLLIFVQRFQKIVYTYVVLFPDCSKTVIGKLLKVASDLQFVTYFT